MVFFLFQEIFLEASDIALRIKALAVKYSDMSLVSWKGKRELTQKLSSDLRMPTKAHMHWPPTINKNIKGKILD